MSGPKSHPTEVVIDCGDKKINITRVVLSSAGMDYAAVIAKDRPLDRDTAIISDYIQCGVDVGMEPRADFQIYEGGVITKDGLLTRDDAKRIVVNELPAEAESIVTNHLMDATAQQMARHLNRIMVAPSAGKPIGLFAGGGGGGGGAISGRSLKHGQTITFGSEPLGEETTPANIFVEENALAIQMAQINKQPPTELMEQVNSRGGQFWRKHVAAEMAAKILELDGHTEFAAWLRKVCE